MIKQAPFEGTIRCGYHTSSGIRCPKIAKIHVLWESTARGKKCVLLCGEHSDQVSSIGTHPAEINCDMPGVSWNKEGCTIK